MTKAEEYELLRKINEKTNIHDISTLLFEVIEEIYPFRYKIIRLLDENNIYNVKARFVSPFNQIEKTIENSIEKLVTGDSPILIECINKKKSVIFNSNIEDLNFIRRAKFFSGDYQLIAIPIKSIDGEAIGIIQIIDIDFPKAINTIVRKIERLVDLFYTSFYIYLKPLKAIDTIQKDHFQKVSQAFIKINQLITTDKVFQKLLAEILGIYGFNLIYFLLRVDDKLRIIEGITSSEEYNYILEGLIDFFNKPENAISIHADSAADMVCSYVYKTNTPIYLKDCASIDNLPMSEKDQMAVKIINRTLKSVLHIPIHDGAESFGVLELFSFDENIVDICKDDMETLINLCSLIPTAIRNSELYTDIQKKNQYIEEQNKKILQELKLAKEIQRNIIPKNPPVFENLQIAMVYTPMEELGGDFFDFIHTPNPDYAGIFISDVSGHGIPAALVTSMVKSLISTLGDFVYLPHIFLRELNDKITGFTIGNFLTAIYALINVKTKKMIFARGAHCYPYIIRDGKFIEVNQGKGKILGFFDDIDFDLVEIQLEIGDKVLFYTDGLTEAFSNELGIEFERNLPEILVDNCSKGINEFTSGIYQELIQFNGSEKFEDDVCLIGLEVF